MNGIDEIEKIENKKILEQENKNKFKNYLIE